MGRHRKGPQKHRCGARTLTGVLHRGGDGWTTPEGQVEFPGREKGNGLREFMEEEKTRKWWMKNLDPSG